MSNEPLNIQLPLKDYLVSVPLLGTTLAIVWEVGTFVPIGGEAFGLFSVSEHISFALKALPLGIFASAALLFLHLLTQKRNIVNLHFIKPVRAFDRKVFEILGLAKGHSRTGRNRKIFLRCMFGLSVVFSIWYFWLGYRMGWVSIMTAAAELVVAVTLAAVYGPSIKRQKIPAGLLTVLCVLLVTFSFGIDQTRANLKHSKENLSLVQFSVEEKRLLLLKAGEKHVLFYEPDAQVYRLESWDDIKRIQWARPSLRELFFFEMLEIIPSRRR